MIHNYAADAQELPRTRKHKKSQTLPLPQLSRPSTPPQPSLASSRSQSSTLRSQSFTLDIDTQPSLSATSRSSRPRSLTSAARSPQISTPPETLSRAPAQPSTLPQPSRPATPWQAQKIGPQLPKPQPTLSPSHVQALPLSHAKSLSLSYAQAPPTTHAHPSRTLSLSHAQAPLSPHAKSSRNFSLPQTSTNSQLNSENDFLLHSYTAEDGYLKHSNSALHPALRVLPATYLERHYRHVNSKAKGASRSNTDTYDQLLTRMRSSSLHHSTKSSHGYKAEAEGNQTDSKKEVQFSPNISRLYTRRSDPEHDSLVQPHHQYRHLKALNHGYRGPGKHSMPLLPLPCSNSNSTNVVVISSHSTLPCHCSNKHGGLQHESSSLHPILSNRSKKPIKLDPLGSGAKKRVQGSLHGFSHKPLHSPGSLRSSIDGGSVPFSSGQSFDTSNTFDQTPYDTGSCTVESDTRYPDSVDSLYYPLPPPDKQKTLDTEYPEQTPCDVSTQDVTGGDNPQQHSSNDGNVSNPEILPPNESSSVDESPPMQHSGDDVSMRNPEILPKNDSSLVDERPPKQHKSDGENRQSDGDRAGSHLTAQSETESYLTAQSDGGRTGNRPTTQSDGSRVLSTENSPDNSISLEKPPTAVTVHLDAASTATLNPPQSLTKYYDSSTAANDEYTVVPSHLQPASYSSKEDSSTSSTYTSMPLYLGTQVLATDNVMQPMSVGQSLSAGQYSYSSGTDQSMVSLKDGSNPHILMPRGSQPVCTFKEDSYSPGTSHNASACQQQNENNCSLSKTSSTLLQIPIHRHSSSSKTTSSSSLDSSPLHAPTGRPRQPPFISKYEGYFLQQGSPPFHSLIANMDQSISKDSSCSPGSSSCSPGSPPKYEGCFLKQGSPTLLALRANLGQPTSKDSSCSRSPSTSRNLPLGQLQQPFDNHYQRDHREKKGTNFRQKCLRLISRSHKVPPHLKQLQALRDRGEVTNSVKDGGLLKK